MRVRFYQGITEIITSELSVARKFLYDAGLKFQEDSWFGDDGKVGQLIHEEDVWRASFWYYDAHVRWWM